MQRFRHPEHGYRSCLGLLSLAKRYGPALGRRQLSWPPGDNYLGRRIDSSELLPVLTCCLT